MTTAELIADARQAASSRGVDPDIFEAQINQESGFNPQAYNERSGASGIAQLEPQYYPGVDVWDPLASLDAAAETDAANLRRFGGRADLMLAAYDAGAGAVEEYGGIPPYAETQTYVRVILAAAGKSTAATTPTATPAAPALDLPALSITIPGLPTIGPWGIGAAAVLAVLLIAS